MPQPKRKKADAPVEEPIFILDQFDDPDTDDVVQREIPLKTGEYLGGKFLRVTLAQLTARQAKKIPRSGPLEESFKACWRYVTDWEVVSRDEDGIEVKVAPYQRRHPKSGEMVSFPAPGSPWAKELVGEGREWELMDMLTNEVGAQVVMWLLEPAQMQLQTERGKARSRRSKDGDMPQDGDATATA